MEELQGWVEHKMGQAQPQVFHPIVYCIGTHKIKSVIFPQPKPAFEDVLTSSKPAVE